MSPRLTRGGPAGWTLAALGTLVAGYVGLWRGGTSAPAVLLVVGYLLLVPLALRALLVRGAADAEDEQPPYRVAGLVALAVLALYVATLAPTTAMWDASEYIAAAKTLGIPHPPGNPMFVLVAHVFALLPIPVSYAERVNLLAATTSALSAGLWFLVTHRSLRGFALPPRARIAAAVATAWLGATAFTVWNQSVVNEKVYTVAMLGVALCAWLALRWNDAPAGSRRADLALLLVAYLCGLGYANHPAGFLPLPAFGLYVLLRRPGTLIRPGVLASAAGMLLLGLTPFLFEPIRATHDPPINVGEATACVGQPSAGCLVDPLTWQRVMSNVRREQYGGHAVAERQAPLGAQFGMWWLYFRWQWWRDLLGEHQSLQRALALLFLGLAVAGGVLHWRRDRESFLFVGPLLLTLTPALVFYLNFKYGASQDPHLGDTVPREVRDRDYFYLWSFASLAIWMGMGLAGVWQAVAKRLEGRMPGARAFALASPVLLLALVPFAGNARDASRRGATFTREWARDLLQSVEPYGILITNGDNDSFPVWYAQHVEGVRRDVTVVLVPYMGTDWYVRQLAHSRPAEYDGSGLPEYAALATRRPTTPPLALSNAEADAIPPYIELPEDREFRHGAIRATVSAGVYTRDQLVTLRLITDAFPARPIYFSIGRYPQALGLGEHVVSHGLAQKLVEQPASTLPGVARYPGGYVDVERSRALWSIYRGPQALLAGPRWTDEPSLLIPQVYPATAQLLAYGLATRGDTLAASRVMADTERLARELRMVP